MEDQSKAPLVRAMWHELYVEMLSSPLDQRTDKEFCEENKLHVYTLSNWKRAHRIALYAEVQKRRAQYINEIRTVAYKHLVSLCKKDVNAIKLMFQLTGDLVEQSKTTHEFMSRKDKIDRINNLLKEANEKQATWAKVQESQRTVEGVQVNPNVNDVKLGDGAGENPS